MNKKYSKWSAILSIICAITIFTSYAIAPQEPEGSMVVLLKILFFTFIIAGVLSLILSYLAFKNKEEGFLKKIAPIIILLILLVFALSLIGIVVSLGDLF
ncbi:MULTISPECIES: hypothetical protein [Sporosarcina]|uniref:hypothetical protein n=1 Tax=Sporosarcina TaxID=1569 RepID=UPI00078ECCD7|nr:hypothetical protein [Sporosarcina psychrophila]AMQ05414.1 hypothetical protein AZE41_05515 [Sporosarcina psychrophila]